MSTIVLRSNSKDHRTRYSKPIPVTNPAYSMRSRVLFGTSQPFVTSKDARPEVTSKNVHAAVKYTSKRAPAFSIVSRTYVDETRDCTRSPGPQHYMQPHIISNLRHPLYRIPPVKGFAGSERRSLVDGKSPGPGEYESNADPVLRRAPAYGFRLRESESMASALSPDCGSYNVGEILRSGKIWRGPSWTVRSRSLSTVSKTLDSDIEIPFQESSCFVKRDTGGSKRMRPVPTWSFSKSRRFDV